MPGTVTTHSREETQQLAAEVAARLSALPRTGSCVVTLRGELGAGKTTFTQGLLRALGITDSVTSPTFMLVHRYPLSSGGFTDAYHVDAYRLAASAELGALGLDAALADPASLVIVEWPEVGGSLFTPVLDVALAHGETPEERTITLDWRT
jgi:tRNA threonylcarbamoyladenosine biosynthesis protein TsaE